MIAGYRHFLGLASRLRWDEQAVALEDDADAWKRLDPGLRGRLLRLVAGFCVGEDQVAAELAPFAACAADADAAACFAAQQVDEARHARFFDRVAAEVAGVQGDSAAERRAALRPLCDAGFLDLFERRLPELARELAAGEADLGAAVGLYHMVLEGVVFTAGQMTMLDLLEDAPELAGLRHGLESIVRDERWHVGFGSRCLADSSIDAGLAGRVLRDGDEAHGAWRGGAAREITARVAEIHHRRLGTIRPRAQWPAPTG